MNLHVRQMGSSGPAMVMLHGWGLHGGVFTTMAESLAANFRISLIDLPGHGLSPPAHRTLDLAATTEIIAAEAPSDAVWLGWSLGGMIAMQMALTAPQLVAKLILVGSSPRFTTAGDWPWAMDPAVLAGFAEALREDYRGTLERFLSLQIATGTAGRDTLRRLRDILAQSPPSTAALSDGLAILQSADLRVAFPALPCPVLSILGERDRLVPAAVAPALKDLLPTGRIEVVRAAGHVPFLSHPREFLSVVEDFLEIRND